MRDHRRRRVWMAAPVVLLVASLVTPSAAAAATDSDNDGLPNTWERSRSLTSPYRVDTDRDGLPDGREDPDRDGLTNRQEYLAGMNPRRADTDRDGLRDGREDTDHDGLRTAFEFLAGTSPRHADTDGDGIRDGGESPDRDGLANTIEQRLGTNPKVADTDGDGWQDGAEWRAGTDPRKSASHPANVAPTPTPTPTPGGTSGGAPTVPGAPGCPVFPTSNVWNTQIDGRAVASSSATMIAAIGLDLGLHMDFGSFAGYGIPYQVVTSSTPRSTVAFDYDDDSDHVGYPIPTNPLIEGGSDRHILLVDRDACRLYELYAARKVGGAWAAGSGATWDLRSNALRPETWTAPMQPACRSCPASSDTTRSPPAPSTTPSASRRIGPGRVTSSPRVTRPENRLRHPSRRWACASVSGPTTTRAAYRPRPASSPRPSSATG